MWLLLLFIHVLGLTGFNLILRKSVLDKIDRFTLAVIMQTGLAIPAVFIVIVRPPDFSIYDAGNYIFLGLIILFNIGLHVSNVKSLQYLEAGVYSIIYNLRLLIVTVLGILFLHEDVIWMRIFGGILIFLAILIVKQKSSRFVRVKGTEWALAAALIISFLNITEKAVINDIGLLNYFPVAMIATWLIMFGYLLLSGRHIKSSILLKPRIFQLMALRAVSGYAFTGALAAGALVSVANYISGMSVILMVVLGALLLKEREYILRKAIATGVAVLGLTIILISELI